MTEKLSTYEKRGVSSSKSEVHAALKNSSKGLFPKAFCKILPDLVAGSDEHCNIMHADTAGTKTALAYLYWKETGDLNVWKGIVQDALVMNLDDMAAVGCVDNVIISSTVGRNKQIITGDVIATIIGFAEEWVSEMKKWGVNLHLSGGETADVGDIVRTIDVGYTTFGRMHKQDLIINNIRPGDAIVGLASFGKASYENEYNSGIGSNGLTSARHDVLSSHYKQFSESYNPKTLDEVVYLGSKRLTDEFRGHLVKDLLLSPTRTYIPLLQEVVRRFRKDVSGIIHCTGGGQTKVKHFIENVRIVKNNLFTPPAVFDLIALEGQTPLKEMFEVFNMGHRMEIYLPEILAQNVIDLAASFDIEAKVIGRVEAAEKAEVVIEYEGERFSY